MIEIHNNITNYYYYDDNTIQKVSINNSKSRNINKYKNEYSCNNSEYLDGLLKTDYYNNNNYYNNKKVKKVKTILPIYSSNISFISN